MSALLDVIMSVIVGGLIVITIILTIGNIQEMNYNTSHMQDLKFLGNNLIEVLDAHFLESVGRNMGSDQTILEATKSSFTFKSRQEPGSADSTVVISLEPTPDGFRLDIRQDGVLMTHPNPSFLLESDEIFYFFDANKAETYDIDQIKGVQVELKFVSKNFKNESGSLKYQLSFVRFFRNVYINEMNI